MTPYKESNDGNFSNLLLTDELHRFEGFPDGRKYDNLHESPLAGYDRPAANFINMYPMSPVRDSGEEHSQALLPTDEADEQSLRVAFF